jgi:hypothetical protein
VTKTYFAWIWLLLGSLLLTSCLSRPDSLAPMITIIDPPSGAIRSAGTLVVRGYAMDDEGISSIRVNNTELLDNPVYASERGKRLIQFEFQASPRNNQFSSVIVARDTSGKETTVNLQIEIDTVPPEVTVNPRQNLGNSRVRISGVARDNDRVQSITIAGQPLSFLPVSEKEFTIDLPVSDNMMVEVRDRAGNVTTVPVP